ncbi:HAD-IB family hydrolase [Shewanella sp. Scap07]|uniref:HAD-IB family hydrolase n=1 Tax=Shewanella sp. Scap07 TaxID=2589987 RepID=UPI0015BA9CDC|nr:HAD-IB family hydrolase [Shewanella sp. Scap07]QLE86092.1 HAD-IB family hydrolase [Shewanella sp. Scap07]
MSKIVFFDFDGTITQRDTLIPFVIKSLGFKGVVLTCAIAIFVILAKLKVLNAGRVKEKYLNWCFRGFAKEKLDRLAESYATEFSHSLFNMSALELISSFKAQNFVCVVVTASPSFYVEKVIKEFGFDTVIGTNLDFNEQGIFEGSFIGRNCNGQEKVRRILNEYDLKDFDIVYAYGNSSGDIPMLRLADEAFMREGNKWLKH